MTADKSLSSLKELFQKLFSYFFHSVGMPDTDLQRTADQIEELVPRSDLHVLFLSNVKKDRCSDQPQNIM